MTLLKFSIDLSKPWISQYYNRENQDGKPKKGISTTRDLNKIWMAEIGQTALVTQTDHGGNHFAANLG